MIASDFLLEVKADLQDKSEQWSNELLFVKLQRAYVSLQLKLPYFMTTQTLAITEGIKEYYLDFSMIKDITFFIDDVAQAYVGMNAFHKKVTRGTYTMYAKEVLLSETPLRDGVGILRYKNSRILDNANCEIELPDEYHQALRLLLMSYIHEKPTLNSKQRNLSSYYTKLYIDEVIFMKRNSNIRVKNVKSIYQKV